MIFSAATSSAQNVLTRQNDNGRTGRQLNENTLNTTNVNKTGTFGKVFTHNSSKAIYWTMTLPSTAGVAPNPLNQYILNLNSTNPPISIDGNGNAVPSNSTQNLFCAPVPTPSISAGPSNPGILWVVEDSNSGNPTDCQPKNAHGAVLHAYDARNVSSTELYNSGSHIKANTPTKFVPPTVFNGRVYVSTYQGLALGGTTGELDVFGLCNGSCIP